MLAAISCDFTRSPFNDWGGNAVCYFTYYCACWIYYYFNHSSDQADTKKAHKLSLSDLLERELALKVKTSRLQPSYYDQYFLLRKELYQHGR